MQGAEAGAAAEAVAIAAAATSSSGGVIAGDDLLLRRVGLGAGGILPQRGNRRAPIRTRPHLKPRQNPAAGSGEKLKAIDCGFATHKLVAFGGWVHRSGTGCNGMQGETGSLDTKLVLCVACMRAKFARGDLCFTKHTPWCDTELCITTATAFTHHAVTSQAVELISLHLRNACRRQERSALVYKNSWRQNKLFNAPFLVPESPI